MTAKKVTNKIHLKKLSQNIILFVTFFSHVTLFSTPKQLLQIVRNKIKKNYDNWLNNKKLLKVKNCKNMRFSKLLLYLSRFLYIFQ